MYDIYDNGSVFSNQTYNKSKPRFLKPSVNKNRGYVYVSLINKDKKRKNWSLHRLIAENFIPNPNKYPCVNHLDGNKLNNDVSNLEWCTYKQNSEHAIKNGLINFFKKNEGTLKYTNNQCRQVMDLVNSGMTYKKAGSIFNMPYSTVAHLMRGSRRKI